MHLKMKNRGKYYTFILESRNATMPVERHRATRLALESTLLLLQHPIQIQMEFLPVRQSRRIDWYICYNKNRYLRDDQGWMMNWERMGMKLTSRRNEEERQRRLWTRNRVKFSFFFFIECHMLVSVFPPRS